MGVVSFAALVDEVHSEAIGLGAEVGEAVDALLLLSPVEGALWKARTLCGYGEMQRASDPLAPGEFRKPPLLHC
ncbi:MAG: hypothetical protein M3341_05455 [Actinomycetota bacterium]|jgi:hypothetical protein|nr:hypothetical protein [Actinomycetota bacterium]